MKKIGTALLMGALLAVPVAASAEDQPSSTDQKNAAKECKALLKAAGSKQNLATTLGLKVNKNASNAYGKCVSKLAKEEAAETQAAHSNAAKTCKAEQAADKAAFDAKYRNLGACVSEKAKANKADADAQDKDRTNAAKACRAEQKADAAKFKTDYRNFGKCVSKKAHEMNAQRKQEQTTTS